MSFPHVLGGNPDSAFWTPDKDIPEKRIRGKSGVTRILEMGFSEIVDWLGPIGNRTIKNSRD